MGKRFNSCDSILFLYSFLMLNVKLKFEPQHRFIVEFSGFFIHHKKYGSSWTGYAKLPLGVIGTQCVWNALQWSGIMSMVFPCDRHQIHWSSEKRPGDFFSGLVLVPIVNSCLQKWNPVWWCCPSEVQGSTCGVSRDAFLLRVVVKTANYLSYRQSAQTNLAILFWILSSTRCSCHSV